MFVNKTRIIVAIVAWCGCGGAQTTAKSSATAESAPAAEAAEASGPAAVEDDGTPRWVKRGGGAVASESGGNFFGVGSASGIKNPALLRTTADNRAREDLAKTLEVFTASLMKDYASSAGEQAVEQAVKTATSVSLKGVDIADHYIAADGTLYSLARLDVKRYADVLKAEEMGAAKSYTTKVDVNDMFKKKAQPPEAPPPPPKVAGTSGGSAPAGGGTAKARSGEKPAWVDGRDPAWPVRQWLCAVGFAKERSAAENGAYASIARIFQARVQSVSKDFMGAYSKTGAQSLEVQSTEQLTQVSTQGILSGVEIAEVWAAADGTTYALACLERAKAARVLNEKLTELEQRAGQQLSGAAKLDKAGKVSSLGKALDSLLEREAVNGELRIVDPDGIGVGSTYSHVDVAAAFEAAVEALKIGVVANGPYDGDFRGALIQGLASRGYKVTDGAGPDMDLLITATIRLEDGGAGTGKMAGMMFARGVIRVEIKNVAQNKILASLEESKKDGSRSKDEAERRVVRSLGEKLLTKVGAKIEQAMAH